MKRLPEAEEIIMSIIWKTEKELTMTEIKEQAEAKYKKSMETSDGFHTFDKAQK